MRRIGWSRKKRKRKIRIGFEDEEKKEEDIREEG